MKDDGSNNAIGQNSAVLQSSPITDWGAVLSRYGTVLAALCVFAFFSIFAKNFLSMTNISNVLVQVSVLMIVSAGLTISVASGEFDLSIGNVASLSGVMVAGLLVWSKYPVAFAILAAILIGLAVGAISGLLVTRLRIPSLIATLGMGAIALGINYAYTDGDSIYAPMPKSFYYITSGQIFGFIPVPVVIAALFVALTYILLNMTRYGRQVVATGSNIQAARLSGINVNRCRAIALSLSAAGAAIGGIMLTSRLGTGQPGAGDRYLLDALTAVFLGMTVFRPGRATIQGTVIGVAIIGMLDNGLNLLGAPFYAQNWVRGGVMILAVSLAVWRREIRFF